MTISAHSRFFAGGYEFPDALRAFVMVQGGGRRLHIIMGSQKRRGRPELATSACLQPEACSTHAWSLLARNSLPVKMRHA